LFSARSLKLFVPLVRKDARLEDAGLARGRKFRAQPTVRILEMKARP
jgi:hypothetical protein